MATGTNLERWVDLSQGMHVLLDVGDWVQARDIIEADGEIHALRGGVGHVLEVVEDGAVVFFERTQLTTFCAFDELRVLCDAEGVVKHG